MNIFGKTFSVMALLSLSFVLVSGCKDEPDDAPSVTPTPVPTNEKGITYTSTGALTISINHMFDSNVLQLSPTKYVTAANDTIKVTQMSYYITNIELTTKQGTKIQLGNANLISFLPPAACSFTLNNIPAGTYTNISYLIGVDSTRNSTGTNQGDLDPNYGMYWSWNTGYVFMRLIGRFSSAELGYSFDIGGTSNIMTASHNLTDYKKSGTSATVKLKLDVARIFNAPNMYDLKVDATEIHSSTSPSIAKFKPNIEAAFTLQSVQ